MSSSKAANLEKSFISNVGDLFKYMDTLTIPKLNKYNQDGTGTLPKSKSNTNLLKSNTSANHGQCFIFQDQMAPSLNALYHLRFVKQMSIAEIFRERMAKSRELLTESKISHYLGLLSFFLRTIDFLNVDKRKPLQDISNQIIQHLNTYIIDPDSVMVGLIPSDDLLNKLSREYDFLKSENGTIPEKIEREREKKEDKDKDNSQDDDESTIHSYQSTNISTSRASLLTNIINWSALDDIGQIAKSVRRYASILRGVDKLRKGDILIVKFNQYSLKSKKTFSIGGFKSYQSAQNHDLASSASTTSSNQTSLTVPSGGSTNNSGGAHHSSIGNLSSLVGIGSNSNLGSFVNTSNGNLSTMAVGSSSSSLGNTALRTLDEYIERKALNFKSQFARFTGERDDYNIKVFFSSEETEPVVVGIEDVIPLNRYYIDSLKEPKLIEKMIQQPTEKFFGSILEESKQQTINYIESKGVDTEENYGKELTILDIERIKKMRNFLYSLYSNLEHPFYQDLEKIINERIDNYLANLDNRLMFMPKFDSTIQELKCGHYLTISKSKIKQYLGEFDLSLDQLRIEKKLLMNGTRKEEVTEWWLKRIETRCNEFLSERGYNFSAVPENYIEQPPNNMKDVFSNLMLIQKILDPNESVIEIITEIKDSKDSNVSRSVNSKPVDDSESTTSSQQGATTPQVTVSTPKDIPNVKFKSPVSSPNNSYSSVESFDGQKSIDIPLSTTPTGAFVKSISQNPNGQEQAATASSTPTSTCPLQQMGMSLKLSNKFINSPMQLIKELKEEIYPVINQFILKAKIILCEQFDLPSNEFSKEIILSLLKENRSTLDDTTSIWIEDMCSDLDYLSEMQRLEDARNEKVLHIVPISGLVMNTFARLENELNTVVELWADDSSEEELDGSGTKQLTIVKVINRDEEEKSLLHSAIQSESIERVEKILESETIHTMINQSDVSGWTPLHAACMTGNADICKLLLSIDEIDVTKRNKDGATVLHYLVRHPLNDKRKEVILQIVSRGLEISCGSRHGETPLHSSAFRGLNDVVTFLLENGSNPNAITAGGETALHYAVTGGKLQVVSTLLEAGAYSNISSKRGTPLELARNYKLFDIITLLESKSNENDISTYWRKNFKTTQQQQLLKSSNLLTSVNPNSNSNLSIIQEMKRPVKIEIGGSRTSLRSPQIHNHNTFNTSN